MDTKVNLEFSLYDMGMLFGLILMGRKHGDQQTYDWAGGLRDRIKEQLGEGDPQNNE